jgi:hypothetical protein
VAISWGSTDKNLRVGIDTEVLSITATSVSVRFHFWVGADPGGWGWNDDQALKITGSGGSKTVNFHKGNGDQKVATRTLSASRGSSSGPTWTVSAVISGAFNGATPSKSASYTVPAKNAGPPLPPTASSIKTVAGSVTSSSGEVQWGNSADNNGSVVDQFRVILATTGGFSNIIRTVTTESHSQQFTGLDRASSYYFRVACHNSQGWGGYSSAERSFTTHPTVPSVVPRNSPSSITASSASLTWEFPSDDGGRSIDEWLVMWRKVGTSTWSEAGSLDREHTVTGLDPATEYEWKVQAKNSVGYSVLQDPGFNWTTSTTLPSAPTRPGTAPGLDSCTVFWVTPASNGSTITGYQIQYSLTSTFGSPTTVDVGLVLNTTLTGLATDTQHYVRVRAKTSGSPGAWSPAASFSTDVDPVPYPVIKYWDGTDWVRLDPVNYWDGTDFLEVSNVKYWNGSAFVDLLMAPY